MNHRTNVHRITHQALRVTAVLAIGLLAACGDDDDTADDAVPTTDAPTEAANGEPAASPDDPYCAVERRIDAHFVTAFESLGATPTEEQMMQAAQTASAAVVEDRLIEEATAIAPAALKDDLALLTSAIERASEGDVSGFMTPESDAAGARVDTYCGLED